MSEFMMLHRLISIVLRRWWLVLGLTAIAATAGFMISRKQIPVYEATVTVMVGQTTQATNLTKEDIQMSELYAQTYADLAIRKPVLQGVVEILDLPGSWEDLRNQVRVSSIEGTQMIEIKTEANTPEVARSIADEVAKHLILLGPTTVGDQEGEYSQTFIRQQIEDTQARILTGRKRIKEMESTINGSVSVDEILELQTEKSNLERFVADLVLNYVQLSNMAEHNKNPNVLTIIETAYGDPEPIRPRVNLNTFLAGGFGLLLALGIIFLWEFLDDSVKSTDDLVQFDKLNLLGVIGRIKGETYSEKLVIHQPPLSPTKESYRMIRNKIRVGSEHPVVKVIVITSAEPEEGKSVTAANLGVIMAQANLKTILIDADFRRPVLHEFFNAVNKSGLANLLEEPAMNIQYCLQDTMVKNLSILPSGNIFQDQADRLLSTRIADILKYLKGKADLIILDSPPAMVAGDAAILSHWADGVIVVVRDGKSKKKAIQKTLIDLEEANANILGYIYNQTNKETHLSSYNRYNAKKSLAQWIALRIPERFRPWKRGQSMKVDSK